MKHEFSLTSPLYHVIITNRVNKAFMKGYTTAGVLLCELFFNVLLRGNPRFSTSQSGKETHNGKNQR